VRAGRAATRPAMPLHLAVAALSIVAPTLQPLPRRLPPPPAPLDLRAHYLRVVEEHYVPLACTQMAVVRGVADLVSQHAQQVPLDVTHVAAMAVSGFFISGAGGALWLRHLERAIGSCTRPRTVMMKSAMDFTCWAPIVSTSYRGSEPMARLAVHDLTSNSRPSP
jgi:hypothetical protein